MIGEDDTPGRIKRHVVDQAVAEAMAEIDQRINYTIKEVHEICGVAAMNALEQYDNYTQSRVRLIHLHHSMKLAEARMAPMSHYLDLSDFRTDDGK